MNAPRSLLVTVLAAVVSCAAPPPTSTTPSSVIAPVPSAAPAPTPHVVAATLKPASLVAKPFPLPGATGPASLDYIVHERGRERVWIPVGVTGSVDVFDVASATFVRVDGFARAEREVRGAKRTIGPSAATVGDGFVYVGDRASNEVCPVDVGTLKPGRCFKVPVPIDGVAYVASAKEIWVTTPKDSSLTVLDASKPAALSAKTVIKTEGEPEGYAVDEARGLFFTNLEDKGGTVVIDVATHKVTATWSAGCNADGPRGVAVDAARRLVFVACTDHVQVLDAAHDGARLGKLDTGAGVDNLDYAEGKQLLYVAAGKAARLTIARVDDKGELVVVATGETAEGARNPVVDSAGNVYVADSARARLLVFPAFR